MNKGKNKTKCVEIIKLIKSIIYYLIDNVKRTSW